MIPNSKNQKHGSIAKRKLTQVELLDLHQEFETDDHSISLKSLSEKLNTNVRSGLTDAQVEINFSRDGPNALSPPKLTPRYKIFLEATFYGFAGLLWICAILCFVLYFIEVSLYGAPSENIHWVGIIVVITCLISGIFDYTQRNKNTRIMESFTKMMPTYAIVIRNGNKMEVSTEYLVVGDLVEIKLGDKIPADLRIIQSQDLRVEKSSVTGENEPVTCTNYPTDKNPLESTNVAFFSTYAVTGTGQGIVIATGDRTMIGRLAGLTSQLTKIDPPIAREMANFVHVIAYVACFFGVVFFLLAMILDSNFIKAFIYFFGVVIANVPEILVVVVTTCLGLTARKMAAKNCLVKNLAAVETLGSTSIICSDKTGTLTQNKMTVSNLWISFGRHNFPMSERMGGEIDILMEQTDFMVMLKCCTLCLRAEFRTESTTGKREVVGDASESGILKFCEHFHHTDTFRERYPKVSEVPFNSIVKYQLSIHREPEGYTMIMKGAPEVLLDFCTKMLVKNGDTKPISPDDLRTIKKSCADLGYLGERVLAYCDLFLPSATYNESYEFQTQSPDKYNFPTKDYRFVGLVSLIDPPRPGVPDAVDKCRTAGIKVIMVTGDHPVTALAIAKKVGIISEGNETMYDKAIRQNRTYSQITHAPSEAIIITGPELRRMSSEELDDIIQDYEEIVFARTSPQQKLIIVESCQRLGEIVAVTGDGVNDSPALRQADIGVAMGIGGSDVAKHAADMILMDDNFASIVTGIEEGRLVFDNLKKSIVYTLTSSVPEMVPLLSTILLGIPLPLVLEMILYIDIGTDLLPAIALAYEKAEFNIMRRPPRNPQYDRLVNKRLISFTYGQIGVTQSLAGFYTYFMIMMFYGFLPDRLIGLKKEWDNKSINDLKDSYGQTWSYHDRSELLKLAQSGFFLSIVITQMIDLIMCKTRINSIIHQGMSNWVINFSFVFEIILTGMLLYTPGTDKIFGTLPLDAFWYWPALPHGIFLWIYDEIRRYFIRNYPHSSLAEETYY